MKKHRAALARLLVVAVVFLLAFNSISAQTENSSPEIRRKTFEKVWKTVDEKYFDPNFGGVDWKAVHERYAPQVANAKTDAEFYDLMKQMLGELKVSHLQVLTPDILARLKATGATTGLSLREIENRVVITRVIENSSAARANLKTGYVITKIDGEAVKNVDDAKRKLYGAPNTIVKVSYLDEADAERETTLERLPLAATDRGNLGGGLRLYSPLDTHRIGADIGYIFFTNFLSFLSPRITTAIESFKDTKGIIIDLRGNGGGDDNVAIKMANLLFDKPTQLMITKTRKSDKFYYKTKPSKNTYAGKIMILVDEKSASASEQIAAGLQEAGRAYVIGKTSEGADLDATSVNLPTGAIFLYAEGQPRTPKGIVIEGRGVIPNLEVSLTRESLLAGRDAQLDAAIEYIKNGR